MLEHWVWLAGRPGLSEHKKLLLLRHFGSPESVWDASEEELLHVEGLSPQALESLDDKSLTAADEALDVCEKNEIRVLTLDDPSYPHRLSEIYDPPLILFCRGYLPEIDKYPAIGVVGTRKASAYGLNTAYRLGEEICRCGGLVISGMAKGIDASAMRGALDAGSIPVGVLGCGPDIIYPKINRSLYEDTCRYGCVMSEYLPGSPPLKWNFPRRNRIISGLSCGVVVVEAPENSGSVITAQHALEQGRDVFAVPGNVDLAGFAASNRLLREGAGAVGCGWDILCEYQHRFPEKVHPPEEVPSAAADPSAKHSSSVPTRSHEKTKKQIVPKKDIDNPKTEPYICVKDAGLSEEQRKVAETMLQGPRLTDDVIAETGLPFGKVLAALTMLEIRGILQRLPGKRVALRHGSYQERE